MASSGSSLESTRPHSRRDLRRSSRSRDTRPPAHHEEADYGDEEITPLPSINPPPGTEIARGIPDPPPHSDPTTGDSSHHNITTSTPPSNPRPPQSSFTRSQSTPTFPPTPPAHLTGPFFPPPRVQAPRPRPPLSQPRATGPPPLNPYAPRPRPRQPSPRDHRTSRTTRSPLTRHHDRRRSPRSRSVPTLADTVDIDTAHLQHHAPDGTTVTVAVHILGDTALAHTNESLGNHFPPRSIVAPPTFPQHVPDLAIPAIIVAEHGQTSQHLAQLLVPLRTAHLSRLLPPFILLLTGTLRWRPLWYYYLDLAIDHIHNLHLLIPPQFHDLPLHHRHFNLLRLHHSLPSLLLRQRNFANSAFNFNNNNNMPLITCNNRLSFTLPSILSFPHSSSTFLHPPYPLPQLHLPIHPPALHPPMLLQQPQNQHQLPRNPPTFPSPSSPLKRPPSLQPPPRQIRLTALLIAQFDQRLPHGCLSNGLGTDLTSPLWNIQPSWATSWTTSWRSLLRSVLRNKFGPHLFGFTFARPVLLTFGRDL